MEAWGIAPGAGKENLISAESAIHFWRRLVPSLPECPNRSVESSFISCLARKIVSHAGLRRAFSAWLSWR
jgi:hypothetical protein